MNLEYLNEKIKESSYTTIEISNMLDVSRTILWRYRTGAVQMSFSTAVKLAKILQIELEDLINKEDL